MEIKGNIKSINHLGNQIEITLVTTDLAEFRNGYDAIKDKLLNVVIKKFSRKRSLNSNAYAWVLIAQMAAVLNRDKWDLYIEMLGQYGVFTHLVVEEVAIPKIKQQWREIKELGPIRVGGKTGIQLQCYFGSSTFDNQEMAVFIDGLISEARELKIETLPEHEVARMKEEWDK